MRFPGDPFVRFVPETEVGLAAALFGIDLAAVEFRQIGGKDQAAFGVGLDDSRVLGRERSRPEIVSDDFESAGEF